MGLIYWLFGENHWPLWPLADLCLPLLTIGLTSDPSHWLVLLFNPWTSSMFIFRVCIHNHMVSNHWSANKWFWAIRFVRHIYCASWNKIAALSSWTAFTGKQVKQKCLWKSYKEDADSTSCGKKAIYLQDFHRTCVFSAEFEWDLNESTGEGSQGQCVLMIAAPGSNSY